MASLTVPCPKTFSLPRLGSTNKSQHKLLFFRRVSSPTPSVLLGSSLSHNWKQYRDWKVCAKLNALTAEKSSNSAPVLSTISGVESPKGKDESAHLDQDTVQDESSFSAFMSQVSDLIKLVDSRDIAELRLKQSDCEILIRKKEALQPATPANMPPPLPPYAMLPSPPPPAMSSAPASAPAPAPAPALPAPAKANTSSHPPLKSPMAGTFYRCPGPGEPPFFKVGDKVQKGQVVCIIEAMKLMNEIEADQSGTITEILLEDGKPVSVDTPLFVIVP